MLDTSYHYLITCGVHVGHSLLNSHRLCGWMVLAQRQKILLIDLSKFLYMFSKGISLLQTAVRFRHPIWFISLDPMKASIVRQASKLCGEYHVSTYWIGGLLTNFLSISRNSWWRYLYLSPLVHSAKQRLRREIYEEWVLTRLTWPRVTFLCGVRKSYRVAKEALRALIPCIGIADTATSAHALSLAVPGNDESLEAIYFYNCLVSQTVLLKKFSLVFSWANGVRKTGRLGNFVRWFAFRNSWRLAKAKHKARAISRSFNKPSFSFLWSPYSYWASSHSAFARTSSLMHHLMQYRLAVPRTLHQGGSSLEVDWEEGQKPSSTRLSLSQVRDFFLVNQSRFNGLVALRFFASCRNFLRLKIERRFRAFRQRRPISYSGKKETFTFRHNYLDLMAPSPLKLDRDYVYKRAVGEIDSAFLNFKNAPLQEIFFHVLSTLFLIYSYYQRGPLQSPSAAVNASTYFWHGPHRRRVHRERSKAPHFFQDVLYGFLIRTLHVTRTVSFSYRLPFLPVFRGKPKRMGVPYNKHWGLNLSSRRMRSRAHSPIIIARLHSRFKRIRCIQPSLWRRFLRLWTSPRRLRRLAIAKAKRQIFTYPRISELSPRAFSFFALNKWSFYGDLLPKLYWQFGLLYVPTRNNAELLPESKVSERNWAQRRLKSYPLLHRSILWIRRFPKNLPKGLLKPKRRGMSKIRRSFLKKSHA